MISEDIIGVKTVDGTAKAGKDYREVFTKVEFKQNQDTAIVKVPVIDDEDWNPDLDFHVQLVNPDDESRLPGADTQCKVTILDEDFPGVIGFEETEIRIGKTQKEVEIKIERVDGSAGEVHCYVTSEMIAVASHSQAIEYEHFLPIEKKVVFSSGETEASISVELLPNGHKIEGDIQVEEKGKTADEGSGDGSGGDEEEEEEPDLIFKIKLDRPSSDGVKISRKNICFVTIVRSEEFEKEEEDRQKLLAFYLAQQNPSWGQQFLNACMLGHEMNEEEGELEEVGAWEAFSHFCAITWKVFFAIVPPTGKWGGYPAFIVALIMIGVVTFIVGDVATILGCSLYIKESVTAITFVALGTSLPDTFASMTAAANSEYADSAIGNITGSNSVNVFLGLGLPWIMGSIYW